MATKVTPKAQFFDLKTQELLSEGRTTDVIAHTDALTVTAKLYAEGGENALHTHTKQDHGFFVVSGEATFFDEHGETTVLGPYQGILLPAGCYYWFQSTGEGNLVMLRFAGQTDGGPSTGDDRIDYAGQPFPGDHPGNKRGTRVPIPGVFFGS